MAMTDELTGLSEGMKKLTAELVQKIKDFSAGIAANEATKTDLEAREAALAEAKTQLEADQLAVAHITDVEAQRVENQRLADENEKKLSERKRILDEQARTNEADRQKNAANAANLAQEWGSYREAVNQLEKDRESYKADVLKGMGIKV